MNKITKGILIALGILAALALLGAVLYLVGLWDLFVFLLVPCAPIILCLVLLILNIVKMSKMKKRGETISNVRKAVVTVCSVIMGTVLVAFVALFIVFAMAIAFM